jgi:hypothetical protein
LETTRRVVLAILAAVALAMMIGAAMFGANVLGGAEWSVGPRPITATSPSMKLAESIKPLGDRSPLGSAFPPQVPVLHGSLTPLVWARDEVPTGAAGTVTKEVLTQETTVSTYATVDAVVAWYARELRAGGWKISGKSVWESRRFADLSATLNRWLELSVAVSVREDSNPAVTDVSVRVKSP